MSSCMRKSWIRPTETKVSMKKEIILGRELRGPRMMLNIITTVNTRLGVRALPCMRKTPNELTDTRKGITWYEMWLTTPIF